MKKLVVRKPVTIQPLRNNPAAISESRFIESEKYRALFDSIPDVIFQTDLCGIIEMINPACIDFFGYQPSEMIGLSIIDFFEDPPQMERMKHLVDKWGFVRNYHLKMKSRDGKIKAGAVNMRYVLNAEGKVVGIDGMIRDTSDKLKAQEEIGRAKEFYETIFNALSADIAVFDSEFKYRFLNEHAVKDHETRKWLIGKTDFDYCIHKGLDISIAQARRNNLESFSADKKRVEWVEELKKNGNTSYILRILKQFKDRYDAGFIVGYGIDVTEMKKAEEKALKRERQLNEAQQIAKVGSYEWDPKTDSIACSDELFNILEISKEGFTGGIEELMSFIHPTDLQRILTIKEQIAKLDSSLSNEFRVITPSGKEKNLASRHTLIFNAKGEMDLVVGTIQDITEQKEFEKRLFQAVIESEEKERNRIAAELHDGVCQDLTVAKLTIELADTMISEEQAKLKEMIERCRKIVMHSLNMTRKVSHQLMPKELFDRHFCDITSEMVDQLNQVDSIQYVLSIQGTRKELSPFVTINLYRVIQEFIRNSQKHSETEKLTIDIKFTNDKLSILLKDYGKGFSMKKKADKGIGLLNIGKRIDGIGGSFTYMARPGKGVELKICFPL